MKFVKGDFFTSSFYSAISTLIKIATAFVVSKIIARYLGAEGLGMIGQLTSFVTLILVFAGGALNIGVTKYVAEFATDENPDRLKKFLATSFNLSLISGISVAILLVLGSGWFASNLLHEAGFRPVFLVFGLTVTLYSLNAYLLAVLNGFKQYRVFSMLNIVSSLVSLVLSVSLIWMARLEGALMAVVVNQSVVFLVTMLVVRKKKIFRFPAIRLRKDPENFKRLSGFVLMAMTSAACAPFIQILIRNFISETFSFAETGIYEAVLRVSGMHLMLITTTLGTYYLPSISSLKNEDQVHQEVKKMLKYCIPLVLATSLSIFLLRKILIRVLFTEDLMEAEWLFGWQLMGDCFKIAAWIISFQMLGKALHKTFLLTEIIFGTTLFLLTKFSILQWGLQGAAIGYAINYVFYLLTMIVLFMSPLRKRIYGQKNQ